MSVQPQTTTPDAGAAMAEWRRVVGRALNGRDFSTLQSRTRDGIVVEPLYPPRRDASPLPGRGPRPWRRMQIIDAADLDAANAQALDDVARGATGLALRFAERGTAGLPLSPAALMATLEGIDLAAVAIRLEPHPAGPQLAAWLRALVGDSGVAPELTAIDFGLDPFGPAARGDAETDVTDFVAALRGLQAAGFGAGLAMLDARFLHEAGATEAQELAYVLATGAEWLRAAERTGLVPDLVLRGCRAALAVDHDQFVSVAKLRALRLLWARFTELCGTADPRLTVHAQTSRRMMTRADPHTNIVRAAIAAFSAAVAGADSIAVLPYSDERHARHVARATQLLLAEEAQLFRVADPAAGAGAIEALTEALAERAWDGFREIEGEGGLLASFAGGKLQARVGAARAELARGIAEGIPPVVGVTVHRSPAASDAPAATSAGERSSAFAPIRIEELARGQA